MSVSFKCLGHSTIKFENNDQIIYVDPYRIERNFTDADIIFITHSHYDHFSPEDILKIKKDITKIIIPNDLYKDVLKLNFLEKNIICVKPNSEYEIDTIYFETIPSYNINKSFHPKEKEWVGYILKLDEKRYYIAGDTDITEENLKVKCDVAFIPIGGIYTMDYIDAAKLTNTINPKTAIPIHYGSIVGTKEDSLKYKSLLNKEIECKIFF